MKRKEKLNRILALAHAELLVKDARTQALLMNHPEADLIVRLLNQAIDQIRAVRKQEARR